MTLPSYQLGDSFIIYPIRGLVGTFHLLYDGDKKEAFLIDTGLRGELPKLERTIQALGLAWTDIKAILLTHGHLDHVGNLDEIKQRTQAPLFAHPLEKPHIDGTFQYHGPSRWCGRMEKLGRWLINYRPVEIGHFLTDNMELPFWGGLRVIHLPGHTEGHCGFYSQQHDLLFAGDLFASFGFGAHLPPAFLNSCPEYFKGSLEKASALSAQLMIPSHYDSFDGKLHKQRFDRLAANYLRKTS